MFDSKKDSGELYSLSAEQQERFVSFSNIINIFRENDIQYSVMSGYGLDGLYGSLTRNHKDIDVLVMDRDVAKAGELLESIGFIPKGQNLGARLYCNPLGSTLVELVNPSNFKEYDPKHESLFFPKQENASLNGISFTAASLEGQKEISRIQFERLGWDDKEARIAKEALMEKIEEKMISDLNIKQSPK